MDPEARKERKRTKIHQFLKTYETHQFCELDQREKLLRLSAIFRSTKFTQTYLNAGVLHTSIATRPSVAERQREISQNVSILIDLKVTNINFLSNEKKASKRSVFKKMVATTIVVHDQCLFWQGRI